MKKRRKAVGVRRLIILFFISLFMLIFPWNMKLFHVSAFGNMNTPELEDVIEEQLDHLDFKGLEEYIDSLESFKDQSISEHILEYIKGADFDYKSFAEELGAIFFAQARELLPVFACITAVALLSGIVSTLKTSTLGQTSTEMISIITYAAALIPLFAILTEIFQQSFQAIAAMRQQMQLIFPIMLTLMAASGGTVSATVCRPAVAFFSTTIVSIMDGVVLPLSVAIIVFSMASKLTNDLKIGKFTAFFKSINKWIIGICVSVYGIFFTMQGITSVTYDGIVRRAAKYAIGNGIPIVGGFLSGGFDLAVAAGILIKNSLGSMGIFLMISALFKPLVLLISVNLLLRLVSAIAQPFGASKISDFLGETAENLHYCTAGLLFTAFLYFLTIMVMIFSTEALL